MKVLKAFLDELELYVEGLASGTAWRPCLEPQIHRGCWSNRLGVLRSIEKFINALKSGALIWKLLDDSDAAELEEVLEKAVKRALLKSW